jgi:hypothetical protein
MGVLREDLRLGTQGFYAYHWEQDISMNDVGSCLGGDEYLAAGFAVHLETGLYRTGGYHFHGWDRKSTKRLKKFECPSPALFGME